MDQEKAKRLFNEGAIFIFLNVPEGTEFGIDMKSWNTGENFRGVKMIPPGIHYIFYSSVDSTGDIAPRSGFFYNFRKGEVLVKKWDSKLEDLSKEIVSEEEIAGLKDNIFALDKFLGPYPYDILNKWQDLTSHLDNEIIIKLSPTEQIVRSSLELVSCPDKERPKGNTVSTSSSKSRKEYRRSLSEASENDLLPHLKPKPGTELRLTKFPDKNYPEGSTPREITKHSLDSTYVLDMVINTYDKPIYILSELEFTYICFLVGNSLEAFEQWKKLVILICSCEEGLMKYRKIYDDFISLIEVQVNEIPEEFLADIVSNNNFVYIKLRELFRTIKDSETDGRLKTKVKRFQETLTSIYGWDFSHLDSENEEDLPVIVNTV